jgi:polyhydroxybutyrate depolymerase
MKAKKLILYSLTIIVLIGIVGYYFLFVKERLNAPSWNLETNSITIEQVERTFDFYIPKDLTTPPSLLFLLHGSKGYTQQMRYLTNYEFEKQAALRKDGIIVYPQGFEKHWNDCRRTATYTANTSDINDVVFFQEMVNFFGEKFKIDKNKVFSVGYSNGGQLCFKLAFELPEIFKGIGVYSANIPALTNNDCSPKNLPISAIIVNGTDDPINPYNGGLVVLDGDTSRGRVLSSMETFKYFKKRLPNTCTNKKSINKTYSDLVSGIGISCSHSKHQIALIKVEGGGHTMPFISKPPYLPSRIGKTETSINSAALIIDFFEALE